DLGVAAHADPQHGEAGEVGAGALLGGRAGEEHVVEDDPGARPGHGGDAGHPGRLERAERLADDDLAVSTEVDPATAGRQRVDEIVDSEPDPWPRERRHSRAIAHAVAKPCRQLGCAGCHRSSRLALALEAPRISVIITTPGSPANNRPMSRGTRIGCFAPSVCASSGNHSATGAG